MKKIITVLTASLIFTSCKKNSEFTSRNDLFIYPVNASGAPLCTGKIYLYNSDTTILLQSQNFDCNEEKLFHFSNVAHGPHIVKAKSNNLIGFVKVGPGTGGIEVKCE